MMNIALPRFRGRIPQLVAAVSVPAGIALVIAGPNGPKRLGLIVYAVSVGLSFSASAIYHRFEVRARAARWLRKLDHSMIYVLIAGSYTGFAAFTLSGWFRIALLSVVWVGASVGVAFKMFSTERFGKFGGAMYITLGWMAVLALPQLLGNMPPIPLALMIAGGLLYTGGAVILLRRRPDPWPKWVGYHEVWHGFVACASLCHFVALAQLASTVA